LAGREASGGAHVALALAAFRGGVEEGHGRSLALGYVAA
jgi:hypothetical protein